MKNKDLTLENVTFKDEKGVELCIFKLSVLRDKIIHETGRTDIKPTFHEGSKCFTCDGYDNKCKCYFNCKTEKDVLDFKKKYL